jgi:hypothetical protein
VIARRLRVGALVALGLAVVAYWASTRTVAGQEFGDAAYEARFAAGEEVIDLSRTSLALLTHASLLLVGAVLVGVALVRARPRLAVGIATLVFGTAFLAELLKEVLPRPALGVDPAALAHNTGPSGHASISMAIALALVMVVPIRIRPAAAAVGAAWATIIATSTLAAGWHRPGDALSGELLALAMALLICAVIVKVHGDGLVVVPRGSGNLGPPWVIALGLMLAAFVLVDLFLLPDAAAVDTGHSEFVTASALIASLAIACVASFTALLRDVDLDAPLAAPPPHGGAPAAPGES